MMYLMSRFLDGQVEGLYLAHDMTFVRTIVSAIIITASERR